MALPPNPGTKVPEFIEISTVVDQQGNGKPSNVPEFIEISTVVDT